VAYAEVPVAYAEVPVAYAEVPVAYAKVPVAYAEVPVAYAEVPVAYAEVPVVYAEVPVAYARPSGNTGITKISPAGLQNYRAGDETVFGFYTIESVPKDTFRSGTLSFAILTQKIFYNSSLNSYVW
jgi:hypothetical protein